MYIPIRSTDHPADKAAGSQVFVSDQPAQDPSAPSTPASVVGFLDPLLQYLFGTTNANNAGEPHRDLLRKRQYNGDGAHDLNVTIGIVVGVLLGVFVIGVVVFLHFFGDSIRVSKKRRRGHRTSSGSSKSSRSSGSSLPPPPPPPPPGPPTAPP